MVNIFKYLHAFNVDDLNIRESGAGGFHGTYTRGLDMGEDASRTNLSQAMAKGNSFNGSNSSVADDYLFIAPAGNLGMVLDNPNGGAPVVHSIEDTSVLVDRVRVGDRLLAVDGEDCTAMTAMQVSKLISLKSEKPARVLLFARLRANGTDEP
jgi:C-terminal processing protease CtpA/Prc